nr:cleavage stimulating factor 64 [Ipomoea batatas]
MSVANIVGKSKKELYDIMCEMKKLMEQNKEQARQILIENPTLARDLLQAQIMLGMVQPSPSHVEHSNIYHQTTVMDKRRQVKNFAFTHLKDSKVKPFTIRGYVAEMKKKNPELCSPFAPMPTKEKNPVDEKQPTPPEKPAASENEIVLKKA